MNRVIGVLICFIFAGVAGAQEEFVVVNDFELDIGQWTGWVQFADYSAPDEPRHSGEFSAMLDIQHDGGWSDCRYTFPEPFDATNADEFRMWVYSDQIFRLRVDLGVEVVGGFRYYGPDDVGKWKELVWWISEEESKLWEDLLSATPSLRLWINPGSTTYNGVDYPNGFMGVIYVDDMRIRVRKPVEREYLPLIGFNQASDADLVSLAPGSGSTFFEIDLSGDLAPTEGTGTLVFDFASDYMETITINLRDFPQIREYDRIHLDVFVDGGPTWAEMSLGIIWSWIDETGAEHSGWEELDSYILGYAVGVDWAEISGQYGPVESEGFVNSWLRPEIAGVFDDPEGTLTLIFTTGGPESLSGVSVYIDNIRLSRPVGTPVSDWVLW